MSDAKISIDAVVNDEEIRKLSKSLSEATAQLKENQKELRRVEKEEGVMSDKAKELRSNITAQKAAIAANNSKLKEMAKALTDTGKASDTTAKSLKDMVSSKLGFNIDDLTTKLTSTTAVMGAMVTAVVAVGSALNNAGRDVTAFSNQFIAFAGSAEGAMAMYNKFNDVYRNTNYDEQKVYDMAKGLLAVGVNANEASDLIMKASDTAASLGKGVEFAEEMTNAFKRLATGGELTEKQYKAIAEVGIDLTNVQEKMRAGGLEAYEALKQKLSEYEGGMANAKKTAAEMEGDIKGNLVEIGRQTALLVDDFFGFSDALKSFYQWVIDTTQKCIDSIKRMRDTLRENIAAADEYARASQEWEDIYGDSFAGDETQRAAARAAYANACADIVKEKTAEAIQEEKLLALEQKRAQVRSIAQAAGSSVGGSSKASTSTKSGKQSVPFVDVSEFFNNDALLAQNQQAVDIYKQAWLQGIEEVKNGMLSQTDTIRGSVNEIAGYFVNFGQDLITNTKSFTEQINDLCKNLANSILNMMMKIYMQGLMMNLLGGLFGGGGSGASAGLGGIGFYKGGLHLAEGGPVTYGTTSRADDVPAMLSKGEFVMNARAVRSIGMANLMRWNNAGHFADGGPVGGVQTGGVNVRIDLKNESGQQLEAQQTGSGFDGESYVIGVVLKAVANNTGGMRSILKGI